MIRRHLLQRSQNSMYYLLIAASLLDVATTYYLMSTGWGWEMNPLMAYGFATIGMVPMLMMKMAMTAEAGLIFLTYSQRVLAATTGLLFAVGLWNLSIIFVTLSY